MMLTRPLGARYTTFTRALHDRHTPVKHLLRARYAPVTAAAGRPAKVVELLLEAEIERLEVGLPHRQNGPRLPLQAGLAATHERDGVLPLLR